MSRLGDLARYHYVMAAMGAGLQLGDEAFQLEEVKAHSTEQ